MAEKKRFARRFVFFALAGAALLSACDDGMEQEKRMEQEKLKKHTAEGVGRALLYVDGASTLREGVGSLIQALAWIRENAAPNGSYEIVLEEDVRLSTQLLDDAALNNKTGVSIKLSGRGGERTVRWSGRYIDVGDFFPQTEIFLITASSITFILGNNITLNGDPLNGKDGYESFHYQYDPNMGDQFMIDGHKSIPVYMKHSNPATKAQRELKMLAGSKITSVHDGGYGDSGGVFVLSSTFTMSGGEIYGNTNDYGGGGGVLVVSSTFTMSGGKIYDNTNVGGTGGYGGGVSVLSGTFTMSGGEIYGNTSGGGGGVSVDSSTFTKTNGAIYGYSAGDPKSNKVVDGAGAIVNGKGHAIYYSSSGGSTVRYRDASASSSVTMNSGTAGASGGWEN